MSSSDALPSSLRLVDMRTARMEDFTFHLADGIVLTQDGDILLQYRPPHWRTSPEWVTAFGGHVDAGESILQALTRELHEELGAIVNSADVQFIGAISEDWTDHRELVHVHFWHDKNGTITGCYEAEARRYKTVGDALAYPKVMDYTRWALGECLTRGLLT